MVQEGRVGVTSTGRQAWRSSDATHAHELALYSVRMGAHTLAFEQGVIGWIWVLESKVWVLTIAWTSGLLLIGTNLCHGICILNADYESL